MQNISIESDGKKPPRLMLAVKPQNKYSIMPLLNEDTKKLIQSFVDESKGDLVKIVELNHKKFPSGDKLINQYNESIDKLFGKGSEFLNRFQEKEKGSSLLLAHVLSR